MKSTWKKMLDLVQTQDPSAAQDDKLGQDLEHDQPAKTFTRGTARRIRDGGDTLWTDHVTALIYCHANSTCAL